VKLLKDRPHDFVSDARVFEAAYGRTFAKQTQPLLPEEKEWGNPGSDRIARCARSRRTKLPERIKTALRQDGKRGPLDFAYEKPTGLSRSRIKDLDDAGVTIAGRHRRGGKLGTLRSGFIPRVSS